MLHFTRWKTLGILGSVLLAILFALPNVLPAKWNDALQANSFTSALRPLTLGLDLQGGANVVLELDRNDLKKKLGQQETSDIRNALRAAKIGYSGINTTDTGITVRILKPEDADAARAEILKLLQPVNSGIFGTGVSVNLFNLSQDGQQFTLAYSEQGIDAKITGAIDQTLKIVSNRINGLGTREATIQQQGRDRIVIQLPGEQDPDKVINLIGTTAKLTFQMVCDAQPTAAGQTPPPECRELPMKENPDQKIWVQTATTATVDGADLTDAKPSFDQNGRPVVTFRFNTKGAQRFGQLTTNNVGKRFAIVLDDVVMSAPVINEPIIGGSGQISGNFTVDETSNLAIVLRSGALPAKLTVVQQTTVGPSLGADSINAGFRAAVLGLVLVMIFMIVAYGLFGIFANIALLVNLVMLIALMSLFGFTLTLPGIAGIVLTMGMAVDSNVIIFERIREEWRNGRSALSSIETGFKAGLGTIIDSNLTALIAAVVLFGVGSGPVKGFAIAHAIGILTTMYTAFTVTRFIVTLWVRQTKPKEVPL